MLQREGEVYTCNNYSRILKEDDMIRINAIHAFAMNQYAASDLIVVTVQPNRPSFLHLHSTVPFLPL